MLDIQAIFHQCEIQKYQYILISTNLIRTSSTSKNFLDLYSIGSISGKIIIIIELPRVCEVIRE